MPARPARRRQAPPAGAVTPRVQLARLAWETALAAEGVATGDPGQSGFWQTAAGHDVLQGIVVTACPDGRFDVELHLVAAWPTPPLHEVSAAIRDGVSSAADDADLGTRLGAVDISFGDVQESPSIGNALLGGN